MGQTIRKIVLTALAASLIFAPPSISGQSAQKQKKNPRNIKGATSSYYGGVSFATDGSLPNGVCFRVAGTVNAGEFFNGLKRVDNEQGAVFLQGVDIVTEFPDALFVTIALHDEPCANEIRDAGTRTYLTAEMVRTLRLSIYWKRGLDLNPAKKITQVQSWVEPLEPYARDLAAELPKRFEWFNQLAVPSAGVPLTESLVFVFRTADGRIAARVAARL